MRSFLLMSISALAIAACGSPEQPAKPTPEATETAVSAEAMQAETARLNAWFDEQYEETIQRSPMTMTTLGRKDKYDQFDDVSMEGIEADLEWRRASVAEMEANFDYDLLSDEAKLSWDLWKIMLENAEQSMTWYTNSYIFEQMGGIQTFPADFLINFHRVDTEEDAVAYIKRIEAASVWIGTLLGHAKDIAAGGVRPPLFAFEQAEQQTRNLLVGAPFTDGEDSALLADFRAKTAALVEAGTIDQARADELVADAEAALSGSFQATYTELADWLKSEAANTEASFGVSALPNGLDYYNYQLKQNTTTDLTADEIHEIGLKEVARLKTDMLAIKDEFGFEGDLSEFFVFLRETKDDERLYFPNTDEGRQGYIDEATFYINNIKEQLPNYFGLLPKADVVVRRVESYREQDGAAQHYFPGTPDGSRPGVYYAHLSDMTAMPKRELEVIAYHEAIPGHHMQIAISQELTDIPQFRTQQFFNAYVEGWALYSEWLAKEMPGTYQDPLSEFGRLGSEMWRAIRLVVDTGLHAKGWTKEQAIEYFQANSAITDQQALSEVERYIVMPGQATGYKIGMIKIQELRANAEAELGDQFDIKGFHDAVLGGGALPLELLEKRVQMWVDHVKAG